MENAVAFEIQYREHQRQAAWIDAEAWKFAKPERGYRVRKAVAQALIALANALAPAESWEAQPA